MQHNFAYFIKPGIDAGFRKLLTQSGENKLPNIGNRVHSNHLLFRILKI